MTDKIIEAEIVQEPAEDVLYIGVEEESGPRGVHFTTSAQPSYAEAVNGLNCERGFVIRVVLPREGKR